MPWFQCPEAVMGHSTKLTEVILSKISHELKDLAKWMSAWDKQVAKEDIWGLWERGQKRQCRHQLTVMSAIPGIHQQRAVAQNSRIKSVWSLPSSTELSLSGQHQKIEDSNSGKAAVMNVQQSSCVQFAQSGRKKNARWTCCTSMKRISRPHITYQPVCSLACRSTFQF